MRQRLGIAQAIMEDPQLLILDEPFNGLDQDGIHEIHELFQKLKSQGKTILLASHSASDISRACDEVFEIKDGVLEKFRRKIINNKLTLTEKQLQEKPDSSDRKSEV